jgi:hypothetical protein
VTDKTDPPAEAGYWHGSASGPIAALREALKPLAMLAASFDNWRDDNGPRALPDDFELIAIPGASGVVRLTVGHARAARAALAYGRPPTREELKAGGAKEVGALGLTHTDKDKL